MISAEGIIREAERKAEEIIKEAEEQARKIIEEAEEQWKRKAESTQKAMLEEASKEASIMISDAKRRASLIVAETKKVLVEIVLTKVWELLEKRLYDVRLSLKNLLNESLRYISRPSKVLVNPIDAKIVEELLHEMGYPNVVVETSDTIKGGVIVISEEGLVINNTIDVRFQQAKLKLLDRLARVLWG